VQVLSEKLKDVRILGIDVQENFEESEIGLVLQEVLMFLLRVQAVAVDLIDVENPLLSLQLGFWRGT
jgi:hypothetical protein